MTTTVTVKLTSADILQKFMGHAGENVDEFTAEVEGTGGITSYLDAHPIYRHLGPSHKATAIACYYSEKMREEMLHPRQVAEAENLIVYPKDPETGEAEPWRDEPVLQF